MQDKPHDLYVLFSATPYRMGRLIRWVTGEPYNHVAIGTEADLRHLYAFARRYYRTPFYGGFVTESPSRYHHNGVTAQIRLYRLCLDSRQWEALDTILKDMRENAEQFLYNHLSALTAPLHVKVKVRNAFTCAEFAVKVLSALGYDFDPGKFYTIGAIARRLEPYYIYSGPFPAGDEQDAAFFAPAPLRHPFLVSSHSFLQLLWRKAVS